MSEVRVIRRSSARDIEEKINDLVAQGFELRGDVKFADVGTSHGVSGKSYVATMIKKS